jgi:hypothetical protein
MKKGKDEAIRGLRECCRQIESLKGRQAFSPEFTAWRRETESLIDKLFGREGTVLEDFRAIYYTPIFLTCRMGDEAFTEAYREGLEKARVLLSGLCSSLSTRGHHGFSPT